ncbi:helix-turn-helix transcriptional regulator [Macrococcus bovicus]|uniref:Helix-turn-helix domain-containing protein n=1 Tax=Macrococcus bovicus TaxID=69968 RepID=A0A4R6C2N5_9STAP|nr:helix-turn-helix domain-containing protein [Macrococcus bovicus]TDM15620.1 helix-turn-helix domain-containing protein [Macrococcus bovicus]
MNKIIGYRKMLGLTQNDMARLFGISPQAYRMKEHGKTAFSKSEMLLVRNSLRQKLFPNITVDEIFFD